MLKIEVLKYFNIINTNFYLTDKMHEISYETNKTSDFRRFYVFYIVGIIYFTL